MLLSLSSSIAMSALRDDAEQRRGLDFRAREQAGRMLPDEVLQGNEQSLPGRHVRAQRQPLRQRRRHLHPHEDTVARLGIAQDEAPRRRQVGHERERVRRIEAERRQGRRHVLAEVVRRLRLLCRGQLAPRREPDAVADQPGLQFGEAPGLLQQHRKQCFPQAQDVVVEFLDRARTAAGVGARAHGADALHEELVEVRREDRQELEALEQRRALVERLGEDPAVEFDPAQVAVDPRFAQHAHALPGIHR